MNKSDIKLISGILIISLCLFGVMKIEMSSSLKSAKVYYENKLVETIDLPVGGLREYIIEGYNGDVVLQAKKNSIRVKSETSPLNLCSKQGWITSSYEVIVCLPNRIVIKLESKEDQIDAVVR